MRFRPLGLALLAAVALAASSCSQPQRQWISGGPNPVRYAIAITPTVDAGAFACDANITVEARDTATMVTLNQLDLTIDSATVDGARAVVAVDNTAQTLKLTPQHALRQGRHEIHIAYHGK